MFVAHLDHGGKLMHQRIPFPLDVLGARYEYLLMKALGRLTDADWLYRHRPTRALVGWLANRVVIPLIHGEVMTPDEVENMVFRLERDGYILAVGICECRHGECNIAAEMVNGVDPNYTCVMIGDWGKGHLYSYPEQYRRTTAEELAEKARFWHGRGRVLSAWGISSIHGFVVSYCHCRPDYCVPLRNQFKRGNEVFSPGYSYATVDRELCSGPGDCEWDCTSRCWWTRRDATAAASASATARPGRRARCARRATSSPTARATWCRSPTDPGPRAGTEVRGGERKRKGF